MARFSLHIESDDEHEFLSLIGRLQASTATAAHSGDANPLPPALTADPGDPTPPAPEASEEAPKRRGRKKAEVPPAASPAPPSGSGETTVQPSEPAAAAPPPPPPPTPPAPATDTPPPPPPAPAAPSGDSKSTLAVVPDADVTLDTLKQEMQQALSRVSAAVAQNALKSAPGGAASLSTADPANYVAIYHALRAL